MSEQLPEHVAENRRYWDEMADDWVAPGERQWAWEAPAWGIWSVPESEVEMLPADMTGMRTIELGCGTGYVSGWMARRGATVVGIDNSERQLETARRLAAEHDVDLLLHHGNAERVPEPDGSFDFAISEYGAAIWCEPEAWLREAHRLLRPGGQLAFLGNHPIVQACIPANGANPEAALVRSYFDLHRLDWRDVEVDPGGIEFCLPVAGWVRLFAEIGFTIDDIREPRAPADAEGVSFFVDAEWAKQWPSELVWKLTKR